MWTNYSLCDKFVTVIDKFKTSCLQAQPISKDDKKIAYRSVTQIGEIHAKIVQANVDTLDKVKL